MKKILNIIFVIVFLAMLVIPFALTDFRKDQVSDIDNQYLPELNWNDKEAGLKDKIDQTEEYLNMRIGLRGVSLTAFQLLNEKLFSLMEHPTYMYGREGHVFFRYDDYIRDFQHLNVDPEWTEEYSGWIKTLSDITKEHDMDFLYVLIPDKKTMYSEYFPAGVNVKDNMSRTDMVLEKIQESGVDYIYLYDAMNAAKQKFLVNNIKYDAGHWNENGAFAALQALYEKLREKYPDIKPLEKDQFEITSEHQDSLQVSNFPIDEDVPKYELKSTAAEDDSQWLDTLEFDDENAFRARYINPENKDRPKILLFHDSYLAGEEKFFIDNFSEVTMIHRYNLTSPERFEYYLDAVKPDIVIFENPERSLGTVLDVVASNDPESSYRDLK